MIFHYDQFEFMFLMKKSMNKEKFLIAAGAVRGYAKEMFSRMYDSLSSETIDIITEYEIYYKIEYDSLGKFLYRKYNLSHRMVTQIMDQLKKEPDLRLYRIIDRSYLNGQIRNFMSEDPMVERIEKILLMN